MKIKNESKLNKEVNPFEKMSMIQFWMISTMFYLFFPLSLMLTYLIHGKIKTKQLLFALLNDFFQTILIFIVFFCLIIWSIYYFLSNLLS